MAVIETWLRQDLKAMVNVRSLQGQVFSLDNGGNLIGVKVTRDGEPVELEGTIAGYCILPDGETINITPASGNTGIQNGNEAYVILPQLAYSVPGQISIVIKLAQGSSVTTLAACTGYVYKSRTSDEVVPPGTPIPDLQTLEEAIANANAATTRANTAAAAAENVDASMSKSGDVITITVTDRDGVTTTETLSDQSEAVEELQNAIATKAEQNGYYPDMTVGTAKQLVSDEGVTEAVPYLYRKSGGGVEVGNRKKLEKIIGGTVAWNQLVRNGNFASKANWSAHGSTYEVANGIATATSLGDGNNFQFYQFVSASIGHKCFLSIDVKPSRTTQIYLRYGSSRNSKIFNLTADVWTTMTFITPTDQNPGEYNLYHPQSLVDGDTLQVKNSCFFDLTAMFGSTIADYIYNLEQATPGAGVAWFRKLFPADYYPYNAGELISVSGLSEHKMVGFNRWDEEWEVGAISTQTGADTTSSTTIRSKKFIKALPTKTYCLSADGLTTNTYYYVFFYDKDKNYISYQTRISDATHSTFTTPSGCEYMRFYMSNTYGTTYKNDICINFSDSSRNGEYEPYEKHSYQLDSSLTLRGIPKLDSENKLYYDGDEYAPDGTVIRRYGVVDLGSLTWSYSGTLLMSPAIAGILPPTTGSDFCNCIMTRYSYVAYGDLNNTDKSYTVIWQGNSNAGRVWVKDSLYTDAAAFKAAMSGVYLVYELATPTTEQSTPYNPIQVVDPYGTEEFVSTSIIPVGHSTKYLEDRVKKLEDTVRKLNDNIITESVGPAPIVSFADGADGLPLRSLSVAIEPVQDLHGYDAPWPGGGGKNLLPMTVEGIKAANTEGTWNGSTYSYKGVSFTILTDNSNNVIGISASGLAETQVRIRAYVGELPAGSYIVSGVPSGGGWSSYWIDVRDNTNSTDYNDIGSGRAFTVNTAIDSIVSCYIANNHTVSNVVFTPMLRLASESDSTFSPYSNICPISGWTGAKVTRTGKNLLQITSDTATMRGITCTVNRDVSGNLISISVVGTAAGGNAYLNISESQEYELGDYILNGIVGGASNTFAAYMYNDTAKANGNFDTGSGADFTPVKGNLYHYVIMVCDGQTVNTTVYPMIRFASETSDAYEPYQGETYDITFPSQAGTVYGGTLDVTSGVLVVDRKTVAFPNNHTFALQTNQNRRRFEFSTSDYGFLKDELTSISSHFKRGRPDNALFGYFYLAKATNTIYFTFYDGDSKFASSSELETWLQDQATNGTPVQVTFELATPIAYQLTPQEIKTLLGINNIWADTGDTTIAYPADTKMYIDNKITQAIAAALNT